MTKYKKRSGFQEIDKTTTKQAKKYPKMTPRREGYAIKILFSAESIGVIYKISLQTLMRKGLTALNRGTDQN